VEIRGEITALTPTVWAVGGDRVFILPETKVTGETAIGRRRVSRAPGATTARSLQGSSLSRRNRNRKGREGLSRWR